MARSPYRAFAGIFAATLFTLMAVGAVLPVLPHYVKGPLNYGSLAVGFAIGAFAFTALASRPIAGHIADSRGRRPVVAVGAALAAVAGGLYFVDLAPLDRRARVIGLYGLAVWGGLALGPLIGTGLFEAGHFNAVWAFCAISGSLRSCPSS